MEILANIWEIIKTLLLAIIGMGGMCFIVSVLGGLLEKIEKTSN